MNELEEIINKNNHKLMRKYPHYFAIYDKFLSEYRGKDVKLLEMGIGHGGSLQVWKQYLGPNAKIYGIDVEDIFKENQIEIFLGMQDDKEFLEKFKTTVGFLDIVIDDCCHRSNAQKIAFESLLPIIRQDGVYICEDVYTSYAEHYGGGYKSKDSFISYMKGLIDVLNLGKEVINVDPYYEKFVDSVYSIHFYSGLVIVKKDKRDISSPQWYGKD